MMRANFAVSVFALLCFSFAIWQNAGSHPFERFTVFLRLESVALFEVDHIAIQLCAGQRVDPIEVWGTLLWRLPDRDAPFRFAVID